MKYLRILVVPTVAGPVCPPHHDPMRDSMRKTAVFHLVLLLGTLWLVAGCDDDSPTDGDADTDSDSDGDGDTDGDSDGDGDGDTGCQEDEQCSDDVFCNGAETCQDGECVAGEPPGCDDGDDCTDDFCSDRTDECVHSTRDSDGDYHGDVACGGSDCDDSDPAINPEAPERQCNTIDDDCDGEIDEPTPLQLTEDGGYSFGASLVWTGTELGMAWADDFASPNEIHFTRLDVDGTFLMDPVAVSDTVISVEPSLVWTGTEFAVAWQEGIQEGVNTKYRITFARFSSTGSVAGSTPLTDGAFYARLPALVWTGTEFAVTWSDSRPVEDSFHPYFNRLSSSGEILGEDLRMTENNTDLYTETSIAWTGTELAVVWTELVGGDYSIWFARIDSDGSMIDSPQRVLNVTGQFCVNPRIVRTGSGFGMTWSDGLGIYFARLTDDGELEGDTVVLSAEESDLTSAAAIVWTGTEFGIAWNDYRDYANDIYFTRLSPEGVELIDQVAISHGPMDAVAPAIAWTGAEYAVVWSDFRFGNNELFYSRVCVPE
jgi:hypothetical protein